MVQNLLGGLYEWCFDCIPCIASPCPSSFCQGTAAIPKSADHQNIRTNFLQANAMIALKKQMLLQALSSGCPPPPWIFQGTKLTAALTDIQNVRTIPCKQLQFLRHPSRFCCVPCLGLASQPSGCQGKQATAAPTNGQKMMTVHSQLHAIIAAREDCVLQYLVS